MQFIINHKSLYYLIQFTWGALMNLIGALVFFVLIVFCKKKPEKFGNCWYIVVGKNWGGLELGTFFLISKASGIHTKLHESGHALQNMIWGPLFPIVIVIPSAIRYWYRRLTPNKVHNLYDSIWFEGQATKLGYKYFDKENDVFDKENDIW